MADTNSNSKSKPKKPKPIPIPSPLVEFILLGPQDDRRQLQDSPVLGDVWVEFGKRPGARLDLLIAPYRGEHAGEVADAIDKGLAIDYDKAPDEANIAFLQGLIVARLTFREVMRVVAPKTKWWLSRWKEVEPDSQPSQGSEPEAPVAKTVDPVTHPEKEAERESTPPESGDALTPQINEGEPQIDEPKVGDASTVQLKEDEQDDGQSNMGILWKHEVMKYTQEELQGLLTNVLNSATIWHLKAGTGDLEEEDERDAEEDEESTGELKVEPGTEVLEEQTDTEVLEEQGGLKVSEKEAATDQPKEPAGTESTTGKTPAERLQELPSLDRFWALTGLILWAGRTPAPEKINRPDEQISYILEHAKPEGISKLLDDLAKEMLKGSRPVPAHIPDPLLKDSGKVAASVPDPQVWQVSLNRRPMPALSKSIPAVKADAATYLFKVNCSEIGWAVIDSGIDGNHPAFRDRDGNSRVKRSFDFKNFRRIVSLSNSNSTVRTRNITELLKDNASLLKPLKVGDEKDLKSDAHTDLQRLADDARKRGPVRWELVEKYVEIHPGTKTLTNHGTHVAGIIGASKRAAQKFADEAADAAYAARKTAEEKKAAEKNSEAVPAAGAEKIAEKAAEKGVAKPASKENPDFADGMCPDILLYDFRVLGPKIEDAEFAIIAALQFIRYLNDRDNFFTIHGANLSLSIPHDVRNFACGRTPICEECTRLVASGVTVVAAAGNHGYKSFETKDGSYDSYAAFSITDPGNADSVLTVGATHRYWPHTYGVSFFSSRGPTGDGRLKPDLVAPGERIHAPLPGIDWGDLDGTSMAAPHVSGAAAMLMARYSELVGQPLRIKQILCESATDLARERSFQGHGMLDVLRAFQSI